MPRMAALIALLALLLSSQALASEILAAVPRALGVCQAEDRTNLNSWLVRQGLALAYRRYSLRYIPEEMLARMQGNSLWASEFVQPWAWRRGERLK